jgi:tetratricopeptide (TPR) repeat protein
LAEVRERLINRRRVVLQGMRGVGKTVLASAAAFDLRSDYDVVWWISAASEAAVGAGLIGLGLRLGWIDAATRESEAVQRVMEALRDTSQRILLVLDDAIDVQSLKPQSLALAAADILLTSNSSAWRRFADIIRIRPWPPESGAEFLVERTDQRGDPDAARELSAALGGLPLALEQAGAYCEHLKIPLSEYLQRFSAQPMPLLDDADHADPTYRDEATTVARTFALAIGAANALNPAAEPLIIRMSLLAEAAIPMSLMAEGRQWFGEGLADCLIDDSLDRALAALATFALIEIGSTTHDDASNADMRVVRIHRLVRLVAAARCHAPDRPTLFGEWLRAIRQLFPNDVEDDPTTWPLARSLDLHLSAVVSETEPIPAGYAEEFSWLLDRQATYRHLVQADYTAAERLHQRALAIDEAHFGPMHRFVAVDLNNLAELKRRMGQLFEAEALYARASDIYRQTPGEHASRLANIENNRAELLRGRGDFAAAEPLYRSAIALEEGLPEPDFVSLAKYHGNLGILLAASQRPEDAEAEIIRALVISVQLFGKYHPLVAGNLNTYAGLLREIEQYERAERLYRSALRIATRTLPPRHPDIAIHMTNFAELLRTTNRPREAERLLRDALAIASVNNLPGDVATAVTMHRLALVLKQSEGSDAAKATLIGALNVFFTYAKMNSAAHPRMWAAAHAYIELCQAEFALSETEAQADLVALAESSGLKLTL